MTAADKQITGITMNRRADVTFLSDDTLEAFAEHPKPRENYYYIPTYEVFRDLQPPQASPFRPSTVIRFACNLVAQIAPPFPDSRDTRERPTDIPTPRHRRGHASSPRKLKPTIGPATG